MKPAYEVPRIARSKASLVAFERKEPSFDWNWHYHPEIELTWIRRGFGKRLVGDHAAKYEAGDLVLIGSNLPHTWASDPEARRNEALVIQFLPQMLPESLLKIPEFKRITQLLSRAQCGLHFSRKNVEALRPELLALISGSGLSTWLRLVKILDRLTTLESTETLASSGYRHEKSYRLNSRLERVTAYIEKNFRESITLPKAARLCGLTPEAFSRFFSKMTGHTFVEFRNSCRIREACRLLSETDLSVTQAAYECGFENLSNFNRRFREIRAMSPRDYRKMYRSSPESMRRKA